MNDYDRLERLSVIEKLFELEKEGILIIEGDPFEGGVVRLTEIGLLIFCSSEDPLGGVANPKWFRK